MEQLEGYPLSRTLDRRRRTALAVGHVRGGTESVRAVGGAHAAGIVHGDVKPENVWLTPRTTGGFDVKVLDFGLARAGASEATAVALSEATPSIDDGDHIIVLPWTTSPAGDRLSPMSGIAGTPAYMSPERLRGEGLSVAADVGSLACSPTVSSWVRCRRPTRRHPPLENASLLQDQMCPATRSRQ